MLTDDEFRLFRNLVQQEAGLYLKDTRKDFLESRVIKRMAATGMSSPYWYYRFITTTKKAELLILLDLLTVNETSFFRNGPQMELFGNVILPSVMKRKSRDMDNRIKIWSAGCSTGEEPYSIAMIVHDASRQNTPPVCEGWWAAAGWNASIFASDLSLSVLETASRGEYEADKVRSTVNEKYLSRYFDLLGDRYRVKEEIMKMVMFDFHNLKNDNGLSGLDIIFCRNVMIYFDEDEQRRLVNKFFNSLNPGGYLLLGHAESLHGLSTGFEFIHDNKGTAYRKPDQGK